MPKNLIDLHEKAKSYDWQFTYAEQEPKFASKYTMPKKGKDPFRTLVRDYMKMEAEKDDRTHGFLDGCLRMGMAEQVEPRFLEILKVTLPDINNAEFQAVAACGGIISSVQNQELRHGYLAQMLDEIRHAQIQLGLRHYYVKHALDPAGWDLGQKALYQHPGGLVSIGEMYHFHTGDPIDCIIDLNVIIETAFTNMLLVATPQVAVANGDHALATAFLSIQSDESRHMANGYGTLMAVLSDPKNIPHVNAALERHFWHAHKAVDAITGFQAEYGARRRPWAYKNQWQEWIVDDFISGYIRRLEPFGVKPPERLRQAAEDVKWMQHTIAQVMATVWPLNFWRSDTMEPGDYEWFEQQYPGWTSVYGAFWDRYRTMIDPAGGHIPMQDLPALPPFCQVCQLPCVLPRLDQNQFRLVDVVGKKYAACSEGCEWVLRNWPGCYTHRRQFWARYHGWDLADVISDLGYLRPDGQTLIGQPALNLKRMWTIEDIRKLQYEVKDPLHGVNGD